MEDDELFELEVDGASQGTSNGLASEENPSESEQEPGAERTADQAEECSPREGSSTKQMPCKRPHPVNGPEYDRSNKYMGTSLPIAIPMSNSLRRRMILEEKESEQSSTFIPPHQLSQRDGSDLEGSVPDAGPRASLLRKRNEIFRKTGFIEAAVKDSFVMSRVSTGAGAEAFINTDLKTRRGALALALTPVPEQVGYAP